MIEFVDVVKSYTAGNTALQGVSMQIEDGEFVFLVGPSGSGKSTILKLITGELKPTSGSVHVNGYSLERIRRREVPYLRRTVGVVFQDFRLIHTKTVYDTWPLPCVWLVPGNGISGNGYPMFWSWWVWTPRAAAIPGSFPAVSSSVLPSPGLW